MIHFGTDGWRAIIGNEFTPENVGRVTRAFAEFLKRRGAPNFVYLGFDRRAQSEESAKLAAGLLAEGGIPVRLSASYCPTPCIAWNTKTHRAAAGMMITASHNPPEWNGIKFKEPDGGAASPEYTSEVEAILQNPPQPKRSPPAVVTPFDPHSDYVAALRRQIDLARIRACRFKIGYDPLFGAGTGYLSKVLESDLVEIHSEADTNFGGLNPEPIARNLAALIQEVRQRKLDVGLSTDGDADRIGAVDENGNFVDSHHIFALMLRHLVEVKGKRGEVIKTVSTTTMIDRLTARYRLPLHEIPIGFKHICKKFRETRALIGGEESGGIAVADWMNERDGLLCGLMLLEIMAHHGRRLGELVADLHREIGAHCFERLDLRLNAPAMEKARRLSGEGIDALGGIPVRGINRIDGIKFSLADGSWLLIRPSGTEPVLRIYAEASEPDLVKNLLRAGSEIVNNS